MTIVNDLQLSANTSYFDFYGWRLSQARPLFLRHSRALDGAIFLLY